MKLELKHLAPYLPYGLKIQVDPNPEFNFEIMTGVNSEGVETDVNNHWTLEIKPILRPLSDLDKFKPKRLSGFTAFQWSYYETEKKLIREIKAQRVNHNIWQLLIELHFDVFDLIEKRLAIDINEINQQ